MRLAAALVVATLLAFPSEARAQRPRVSLALAGDLSLVPEARGFGIAVADLRVPRVAGGDFHALYNTDTLQLGLENIALGEHLQLNLGIRGQALFAGMFQAFIARGSLRPERSFDASYVQLFASLKWLPAHRHAFEFVASARQWFFSAREGSVAVPDDVLSLDPRLRYVYWSLAAPPGDFDATVFHPRFEGIAFGVEIGAEFRVLRRGTGTGAAPPLRSSALSDSVLLARQWLRAGARAHPRARLQLEQSASVGLREDDATRVRVGGMNPYAVQVPGLPWPALLSDRHLAALASVHLRPSLHRDHELGVALGAGVFNDPGRVNDLARFAPFAGVAIFGDLRWGRWIVHTRVGLALPSPWLPPGPGLGAFVTLARRWD